MPSVSEVIIVFHAALASNSNECQLLDFIDQHLFSLRARYREHREEFTLAATPIIGRAYLEEALKKTAK